MLSARRILAGPVALDEIDTLYLDAIEATITRSARSNKGLRRLRTQTG
jgi:hypothetical protein